MDAQEKLKMELDGISVGTKAELSKIAKASQKDAPFAKAAESVLTAYAGLFFGFSKVVETASPFLVKVVEVGLDDSTKKLEAVGRYYARLGEEVRDAAQENRMDDE